jgi:hypothetical protein
MTKFSTKTLALAGAAIIALATAIPIAHANDGTPTLLASSQGWHAQYNIIDGRAICSIGQSIQGHSVGVSVSADEATFAIRAYKESWQIPATISTVPMDISFDGVQVSKNGHGIRMLSGKGLVFQVLPASARDFVHWFTADATMTITFSGTEAPWTFNLAGTTGVWPAFIRCAQTVNPTVVAQLTPPPSTQPFAATPPATQPDTTPAPSQPPVANVPDRQV